MLYDINQKRIFMPFSSLMTDMVSLIKKDGTKINDIKSSVQGSKIFIDNQWYRFLRVFP